MNFKKNTYYLSSVILIYILFFLYLNNCKPIHNGSIYIMIWFTNNDNVHIILYII